MKTEVISLSSPYQVGVSIPKQTVNSCLFEEKIRCFYILVPSFIEKKFFILLSFVSLHRFGFGGRISQFVRAMWVDSEKCGNLRTTPRMSTIENHHWQPTLIYRRKRSLVETSVRWKFRKYRKNAFTVLHDILNIYKITMFTFFYTLKTVVDRSLKNFPK